MADGQIVFEFATEGEQAVSAAVVDLKTKSIQAAEAAGRMGAELRKIKQSGQLSAQGIAVLERELAQAQLQAARFAAEASKAAAASQRMGAASQQAAAGVGQLQGGSAEMVNMITEMMLGFSGLSPAMREFATAAASGGNNVVQLSRVMGPLAGTITGLGMSLIPLLITKIVEWTSETDEASAANERAARSAHRHAQQVENLIDALRRQRQAEQIASGAAGSGDVGAAVSEAQGVRDVIERELGRARESLRAAENTRRNAAVEGFRAMRAAEEEVQRQRRAVESLEESLANARRGYEDLVEAQTTAVQRELGESSEDFGAQFAEAEEDEEDRRRHRRARAHRDDRQGAIEREREFFMELERLRDQDYEAERRLAQQRARDMLRVEQDIAREIEREDRARQRADEREARRAMRAAQRDLREMERAAQARTRRIADDAQNILQPAVAGITDALSHVIAGSKSADEAFQGLLSSFLEMISQQTALSAAKEFAEAIAAFASYRYDQGAQHLAAGVAFTAVAVAAGAASVAVAPSAAAAPAPPQQGVTQQGGGGGSLTLNVNGPIITPGGGVGAALVGRELGRIVDTGRARFGMAA